MMESPIHGRSSFDIKETARQQDAIIPVSLPLYARTGFSCGNLWTWKDKCNSCGSQRIHIGPDWSTDGRSLCGIVP